MTAVSRGMFCVARVWRPGSEDVVGLAVAEEDRPLALAHDQLRAQLELARALLGDAVDHLGALFVDELDEVHEGHRLPPCSGDEMFPLGELRPSASILSSSRAMSLLSEGLSALSAAARVSISPAPVVELHVELVELVEHGLVHLVGVEQAGVAVVGEPDAVASPCAACAW